jgi:hypothetical protein
MKRFVIAGIFILIVVVGFSGCMEENSVLLGKSATTFEDICVSTDRSYPMNLSNPYEIAYYGCAEEAKRVLHEKFGIAYSDIEKYEIPQFVEPQADEWGFLDSSYYYKCTSWMRPEYDIKYKNGTETSGVVSKQTTYWVYGYLGADNEYGERTIYQWNDGSIAAAAAMHNELFNPNNVDIDWSRAELYSPGWTFLVMEEYAFE